MERPEVPDPDLLAAASQSLAQRLQVEAQIRYQLVERVERPRSTIFRLRANVEGQQSGIEVYYKVDFRPEAPGARERAAQNLRIEATLSSALEWELNLVNARVDALLASDPDRLAAVRIGVPGRPLGRILRWLPRFPEALPLFDHVGSTLAAVDVVGRTLALPSGAPSALEFVEQSLSRAESGLSRSCVASIREDLQQLADRLDYRRSLVWAHNDLSQTNILVDSGTVGLIDFSWTPRPEHSDLAHLHARLECERPAIAPWTQKALSEIRRGRGLGSRREVALDDPAWRVALLERALRFIPRHGGRRGNTQAAWGWRTLSDLGYAR